MSVEKSELKIAVIQSLGCDVDDDLCGAEEDALRAEGRIQASSALEAQVTKIIAKLDADMGEASPPFPDLEMQKKAKHYLGACLAACLTLKKQSDNLRLQEEGRVLAFQRTVGRLDKLKTIEMSKVASVKALLETSVAREPNEVLPRNRLSGMHPGPSLADLRRSEDVGNGNGSSSAKKKAAKKKRPRKKAPKKKA